MTALRAFAAVAVLSGLSACTYWSDDLERVADMSERNFEEGAVGFKFKDVDLREVAANPIAYKYTGLRFQAVLDRRNEQLFVPLFSHIKADDYQNFSVWPLDARIWEEAGRMSYVPTVYVRKSNKDLKVVTEAPRYSILEIRGWVSAEYQGRPFIEVVDLRLLEPAIYTDESLAALQSGYTALEQKRPAVAIEKLEKALEGVWARSARLTIRLQLAALYFERGEYGAALGHYEGALVNDPDNAEAKAGIEKCHAEMERLKAVQAGK
jgi:tetratricopeptide (TPR) repeat protein